MFSELRDKILRESRTSIFENMTDTLYNKEVSDVYTKRYDNDLEIQEVVDSLPITSEVDKPDVADVIENFIPKARL